MRLRSTRIPRLLPLILLLGTLLVPVAEICAQPSGGLASPADSLNLLTTNEDELLVLEVRLERGSTGHGLIAYPHGDTILLPLGELSSILELAVLVDPYSRTAEGWVVSEDRTFGLDLSAGTVTIDGRTLPLPPSSVAVDDQDIYVLAPVITRWLPFDVELNLARMYVTVLPRETLPFQKRRERDEQRSHWLAAQGRDVLVYPLQVAPYRMWSWPLVDATLGMTSNHTGTTRRLNLESYADLGGLSANLFVSAVGNDDRSRTIARVKAGRWDPDGELLGSAHATQYAAGDLYISRVPLMSARKQGVGFTLSNQSLHRSREFDVMDVQGDAPPGWEAELYINGTLYDFLKVGEDGHYVFTEVPIVVGNNIFRTVLYGPRGEKREVVEHANISPEMSEVGELKYTATVLREGEALLTEPTASLGGAGKSWNEQVELSYAPSMKTALVANVAHLSADGQHDLFTSLTSHNTAGPVYLETILAASETGGKALSLGARTQWLGQNLLVQTVSNDEYRAESPYEQRYVSRQNVFRGNGSLTRSARQSLFYSVSAIGRDYADSDLIRDREYKGRVAGNWNRWQLSHSLQYRTREYTDYDETFFLGSQLARTWIGPVSVRGDLQYEIGPFTMRAMSATATVYRDDRLQATLRLNRFFHDEFGNDSASLEVTRLFDRFTLGLNYSHYEETGSSIGVTLGTFLARDNRSNSWAATHRHMASRAAASVRTYVDLNANRIYDGDDIPLKDVGFLNLVAWRKIRTRRDGIALLPGLQVHRAQTIELDLSTVDDPFLVPVSEGVNVLGHPGCIIDVELPFTYVGEVEGTVVDAARPESPVRNVGLELIDGEGKRVAATVVEFDGFYYLADVFPGEYRLRVVPATVNARIYEIPDPVAVSVPGRGGYVAGPDIVLRRKPRSEGAVPVAMAETSGVATRAAVESTTAPAAEPTPPIPPLRPVAAETGPQNAETDEPARPPLRLPRDGSCTGR